MKEECIFCKIINENVLKKVYEDDWAVAFMDIAKDVDGHIIAVPKKHVKNILDCDTDTLGKLMDCVKQVSNHLVENCGYDGVNLLNASDESAGQSVEHFHIHIIPRRINDGIDAWPVFDGAKQDIDLIWKRIKMINHKGTQTIHTERLTLRKIQENDYIDMYKYTVKEEVAKYVSWTPHESINDTKALCDMWIDEYKNNNRYNWVIVYENKVIGNIDVVKIIDTTAMLGWQIDSTYWNKGIVTEAATAVRDFLFNEIGIEAIEAEYVEKNIGSGRVMQKIGMTEIPLIDSLSYSVRRISDVDGIPIICYKLTKKDWMNKQDVKILKVERDTAIAKELLDFIKDCSWLEVKEHLALMVENWNFTEWETMFVGIVDKEIVGMCSIMKTDYYPLPDIYPWISSVYVTEAFRGNRISEKLIEFTNDYAKNIGFNKTYIPTEFDGLYEKYGYQFIKEITNYGGGIDRLLVKEI